jgi:hypothetical protein
MIFAAISLAGCVALASAQVPVPVAVTATAIGANSAPYEYGSYQISLVDSSGAAIQSSGTVIPPSFSGSLSSTGSLAVSIYPNSAFAPPPGTTATYWKFAICSAPAYPAPASLTWLDTYQQCYSSLVTVSAAGDYSTAVSAGAPALYYQDNKTGVAYFGSGGSGASSLSGGSAGAQPYQTALNTTAFVYPATDTHNLTLSLNRTDGYVEDGTIERPYKNLPTLVIPSTGLASVFTSPNASYANSVATVLPAIPLTVYGNNSTWTVTGGLTLTAKTISYDLIDGAAVTYNYAGTDRSEKHGGAFLGNVNLAQGYLHAFGTNLSGNSNIFTVGGASTAALLYGEAITGSQKITSGGPGALIALYNPNMIKSSGYNVDMTAGGQLLLNGGLLSTVAGTANIYLPTANSPTTAHAISGLITTAGAGVSCPNSNVYLSFGFNLTTETGCILVPGNQGPTNFLGAISSTVGIAGVTSGAAAAAGYVGQPLSSLIPSGSAVSLTTATPKNVTSITLTAGDWDVSGSVTYVASTASASVSSIWESGIGTATAALPTDGTEQFFGVMAVIATTSFNTSLAITRKIVNVSVSTPIYLVAEATFTAGTVTAYGNITARRVH